MGAGVHFAACILANMRVIHVGMPIPGVLFFLNLGMLMVLIRHVLTRFRTSPLSLNTSLVQLPPADTLEYVARRIHVRRTPLPGRSLVRRLQAQSFGSLPDEKQVSCEACMICLESFGVLDEVVDLPCQHLFHAHCFGPWAKLGGGCPCRCQSSL